MIRGREIRKLDSKGRIVVPNNLCSEKNYFLSDVKEEVLLFPESVHKSRDREYLEKPVLDLERIAHFSAIEVELDKNNRILIPSYFRKKHDFSPGNYELVGNGECIIIRKSRYPCQDITPL